MNLQTTTRAHFAAGFSRTAKPLPRLLWGAVVMGLPFLVPSSRAAVALEAWVQRYDGSLNNALDQAVKVACDAEADVIVTGSTDNGLTGEDILTFKYSGASGDVLWQRRYDGPFHQDDSPVALAIASNGDVVVTGNSEGGHYTARYAAADGAIRWERFANIAFQPTAMALDAEGNVVVTGYAQTGGGFIEPYIYEWYTAKLAADDGSLVWDHVHDIPYHLNDFATAVGVDGNGDVFVTGYSKHWDEFVVYHAQIYTVKYAGDSGSPIWIMNTTGPSRTEFNNVATALAVDTSGDVVVVGESQGDYFIARHAAEDGALLWEQRYHGPSAQEDRATAVAIDSNGFILVTGYSASANLEDYFTAKIAGDGTVIGGQRYDGGGQDLPFGLALDAEGNVVVTGSSTGDTGGPNYFTVKYGWDGFVRWEQRYDGIDGSGGQANSVAVDGDGNVVVTGFSWNGNADFYTAKYAASDGSLLWEQRYNGAGSISGAGSDAATDVVVDSQGDVVVTGYSRNDQGNDDYYTAKYAAGTGSMLWEKRYRGPWENPVNQFGDDGDRAIAVAVDANGDVIVTGYSRNLGDFNVEPLVPPNDDFYTAKYAGADGSLLWEQRYDSPDHRNDRPTSVAVEANGDAVVLGSSDGAVLHLARYSAGDGTLLWQRRQPGVGPAFGSSLALDAAGNPVVTGSRSAPGGGVDIYTMKCSAADGTSIWEQTYNGPANKIDTAAAVAVDSAGNVTVTGSSHASNGLDDIYTARYAAANGALIWERRYNGPWNSYDEAVALALDGNGNVVLAGYSYPGVLYTAKYAAADGALLWETNGAADRAVAVAVDANGNAVVSALDYISTGSSYYTVKFAGANGALMWERRYTGAAGYDRPAALALAPDGAVIVAGSLDADFSSFETTDFATVKYVEDPAQKEIVISELLARPRSGGQFIELFNPTQVTANIAGWLLTDTDSEPQKFRIPDGTTIGPTSYVAFTATQFNPAPGERGSFALSPRGGVLHLFSADTRTNLTGYRHARSYSPSAAGESFGLHFNSEREEQFAAERAPTPGAANSGPRVGPVVMSEIHYHPPAGGDEFLELRNLSATNVPLHLSNVAWRIPGLGYTLPAGLALNAGQSLLVVGDDPSAFRSRYGIPPTVQIVGPYSGALSNDLTHRLILERPDFPPDAGGVSFVTVEEVHFSDRPPWPVLADGAGPSIRRQNPAGYGNEPTNWIAAMATPGGDAVIGQAPVILAQPQSQSVVFGQMVTFSVGVSGGTPLHYQWARNGASLAGATNPSLMLPSAQPGQAGSYTVTVFNGAGAVNSTPATLTVLSPIIHSQPVDQFVRPGSNGTFNIVATGSGPVVYQWQKNGATLPGATAPSLPIVNAQPADEAVYHCVVTDSANSVTSAPARLILLFLPFITEHPFSQSVVPGATVVLSIAVTNNANLPMGYRLRRNDITLPTTFPGAFQLLTQRTAYFVLSGTNAAPPWTSYAVVVTNLARPSGFTSLPAILTYLTDTDGDGLPDDWEARHGLGTNNPADAALDTDDDTMSNAAEYIAGTDPTDAASYLKIDSLESGTGAIIRFRAVSNRTYTVEFVDQPGGPPWQKLADAPARGTNRVEAVPDPEFTPRRFYRLRTPASP